MRKPGTKAFTLHVCGTADTRSANSFENTCDIWTNIKGATLPNGTDLTRKMFLTLVNERSAQKQRNLVEATILIFGIQCFVSMPSWRSIDTCRDSREAPVNENTELVTVRG